MLKSVRENTWPVEGNREASTVEAIRAALVEREAMGNLCWVGIGAVPPPQPPAAVAGPVVAEGAEPEEGGVPGMVMGVEVPGMGLPVPGADAEEDEEGPLEGGEVEVRVGMMLGVAVPGPVPVAVPVLPAPAAVKAAPTGAGTDPPVTMPPVWFE